MALLRRWRWWVIANRCASSRTRCSRYSPSLVRGRTSGWSSPGSQTSSRRLASPHSATSSMPSSASARAAAARALAELGIDDVALCGLAKRLEEVWLPGDDHPLVLPRTSEGLYLLQRVRDEAHRFAITHHRQRRSKAMTTSLLDEVPGIGPRLAETITVALHRESGQSTEEAR